MYPWIDLSEWQPFRVDALGLITLLGAEEINTWVGRLVPSKWMEYMPLLAMYVISGDRFRDKSHSFALYNLSAGIFTTECAAWFTRWVNCQNFNKNRVIVFWEIAKMPEKQKQTQNLTAILVSACFTGLLLIASILARDFYGTANACAIIVSILTRAFILHTNRSAIDDDISRVQSSNDHDKLIVITPDANVVTMSIPKDLIIPLFIRNPKLQTKLLYKISRGLSWIAFGVHVTALGMASLANQIYTIALILVSSILVWHGFGCADMLQPVIVRFKDGGYSKAYTCWIGSYLKATIFQWPSSLDFEQNQNASWRFRDDFVDLPQQFIHPRPASRMDLYAWLNLTDEEETSLSKWDLIPHQRQGNLSWERAFHEKQALVRERDPVILHMKRSVDICLGRREPEAQQPKDDVESLPGDNSGELSSPLTGRSQSVPRSSSITGVVLEEVARSKSAPPSQTSAGI